MFAVRRIVVHTLVASCILTSVGALSPAWAGRAQAGKPPIVSRRAKVMASVERGWQRATGVGANVGRGLAAGTRGIVDSAQGDYKRAALMFAMTSFSFARVAWLGATR